MHANNEVGTLQPIREIANYAKRGRPRAHGCASIGRQGPVERERTWCRSAQSRGTSLRTERHRCLVHSQRRLLEPSHARGSTKAGGDENTPYIVDWAGVRDARTARSVNKLKTLRDRLFDRLHQALGDRIVVNGHPELRLPNTLNINFLGHVGAELLAKVPEIAASTGSACHEGSITQSPVLCAMGVPPEIGKGAVRLSVGRFTTEDEVDRAADLLIRTATLPV